MLNRGWEKFRCKKYQGQKRFIRYEKPVTDNNPKGEKSSSYLACSMCSDYSQEHWKKDCSRSNRKPI